MNHNGESASLPRLIHSFVHFQRLERDCARVAFLLPQIASSSHFWGASVPGGPLRALTGGFLGGTLTIQNGAQPAPSPAQSPEATAEGAEKFDPLKQLQTQPAEEVWTRYFEGKPASDDVRRLVLRLHRNREHAQVVTALRSALLAGRPEPWMYEVLALSMEIEGAPKEEVERVMLSMVDFNVRDLSNLLGSAAYLVRLGAHEQALKMYRQVAALEPSRPEPYLLGSKLADRLQDIDAIIWAGTGILTYYWFDDYQLRHQEAQGLLQGWKLKLEKRGEQEQAQLVEEALGAALRRDLQIRLTWSGEADLDLIIHEPLGSICSYDERYTAGGGALLHEGAGPNQANCYEEYVCAFAAAGYYIVHVEHVTGKIVGNRARLEVIRYAGTEHEQRDVIPIVFDERVKKYRISLHRGRRTEETPVFKPQTVTRTERRLQTRRTLADVRRGYALTRNMPPQGKPPAAGAVAFAPQISMISSGVSLSAQAVVSPDRRYVRIGINPSFTDVVDIFTFSFIQ